MTPAKIIIIDHDRRCAFCGRDGALSQAICEIEGVVVIGSYHSACSWPQLAKGEQHVTRAVKRRAREIFDAQHTSGAIDRARRQHGMPTPQAVN